MKKKKKHQVIFLLLIVHPLLSNIFMQLIYLKTKSRPERFWSRIKRINWNFVCLNIINIWLLLILAKKDKMADTELVTTALEFLARASSTSEVLTLNLTNLLILLVLKALIFGFGLFSVGGTARSAHESTSFSETDLQGGMCFMMHMAGDDKMPCIQKAACQDTVVAAQYATASKMMYKVFKLLK